MLEASWSTKDGMTSFWTLLVVIFDLGCILAEEDYRSRREIRE
jgi:hypothetical protein